MKNMCLWTAIALMTLAACSEDKEASMEPGAAENFPAEIHGTINGYSAVSNSRGINGSWADGEAIGITTAAGLSNVSYVVTEDRNVKYAYSTEAECFQVVNPEGADHTIYFKGLYDMKLYAYAPYVGERGIVPETIEAATTSDLQAIDRQTNIDFLYAEGAGSQKNPKVDFIFHHRMSNILLNFKPKTGVQLSDLSYKLKGLKLDGTYTPSTGVAALKNSAIPQDIEMRITAAEDMKSSLILYPQTFSVSTILEVIMGNKSYAVSPSTDVVLEAGQQYVFDVLIGEQEMTINLASIVDWEVDGEKFAVAKKE
ncbi:fimbrillin family protein [Bacteroides clarus]|uniref:fimbrillin family protein n=1 Tax=Bacteroides clarus TaxID=626929 RepID=UPI00248DC50F|nr:fimbrillin family protein [Bacteroides clarus]